MDVGPVNPPSHHARDQTQEEDRSHNTRRDPILSDKALCDKVVADCFGSKDYIEGRRAFMEKRKPVFTGT